jgi:hypothetical protein
MRYVYVIFILLAVTAVSILGFRGTPFKKPPLEIFRTWITSPSTSLSQQASSSLTGERIDPCRRILFPEAV